MFNRPDIKRLLYVCQMSNKTKTVVVKIPDPEFIHHETLRESATRRYIQQRLFTHFTSKDSPFRKLLCRMHSDPLVDVIEYLMKTEGVDSETCEAYMMRIVDEFRVHSPIEMFLHYMETENVEKAAAHYTFFPMQHRFLEISTITEGYAVKVRCKKDEYIANEFDCLCEELGLGYRATKQTRIVPDEVDIGLTDIMDGRQPRRSLNPVSINDLLSDCKDCGG